MKPAHSVPTDRARVLAALLAPVAGCTGHHAVRAAAVGVVQHAPADDHRPRVDGHAGDLVLHGSAGTALTFAATPDAAGHRPLRGAVVDVIADPANATHADPLVFWRPAWFDASGGLHALVASTVESIHCVDGSAGVRVAGSVDAIGLESTICATTGGRFVAVTIAHDPLPDGATLGDQLDVGEAAAGVDGRGEAWTGEVRSRFVSVAERGTAFAIEAPAIDVRRDAAPDRDELSRAVLLLRYGPGPSATRMLHVVAGDGLAAVGALSIATRAVTLRGDAREFDLRDPAGARLYHGDIPASGERTLHLPSGLGSEVLFRDAQGVPASGAVPLAGRDLVAPVIVKGGVRLSYVDAHGDPLPVHVLFRALGGMPDPTPRLEGTGYSAGRSVYLLDGQGQVALAPGRYRATATHGTRFTLDVQDIELSPGANVDVHGTLREVVDTSAWTAGDFHLHASPSPDSHVSLPERVAALRCEGVDFAVATDHNRVTDYGPTIDALGVRDALASLPGEEVTTFAPYWGHFIAYPMPLGGARSAEIVPFYSTTPSRIFADARERGARIVQVNHPRMRPTMGYFDWTHLDPATGRADQNFAAEFDAVEAFNGWYIEHPDEVRRNVQDLVALARRGMHPTATGNSDSHLLLFEEAGYPRTYVHTPRDPAATEAGRVINALLFGHTTVSAGPFVELNVVGAHGEPGDTVQPDAHGRVRVHVRVTAPAWVPVERVEVWLDDTVARTFAVRAAPTDGVRFEDDVELDVPHDAVVLAWADAQTPLPDVLPYPHAIGVGFTGLLYVDADRDGRVIVPPRGGP